MPRKYTRKTLRATNYTAENLRVAIERVRSGDLTNCMASKIYNIPKSTLNDRVQNKTGILSNSLGRPPAIPLEHEARLADCLKTLEKWGSGLSRTEVMEVVAQFIKQNKIKTPFKNDMPGPDWYIGFRKRHQLSIKKPQPVEYLPNQTDDDGSNDDESDSDRDSDSGDICSKFVSLGRGRARCTTCHSTLPNTKLQMKNHWHKYHNTDNDSLFGAQMTDRKTRISTSQVWNYFDKDHATKKAECHLCKKVYSYRTTVTNLKQHLKLIHKLEDLDDEDNNQFSEVVYLDEPLLNIGPSASKRTKPTPRPSLLSYRVENEKKSKVVESNRSHSPPKVKLSKFDEECEKFGEYIVHLLKSTTPEVCSKLQMEIVALIMNEKIKMANIDKEPSVVHHYILRNDDDAKIEANVVETSGTQNVVNVNETSVVDSNV